MRADKERYRALLRSVRPDLSTARFDDLGEGWDNILFVIDEERIVRFAKDERTSRMLESEASLLQAIGPALPVRTPHPEFVARSPVAPDIALMIYRRIPGLSLDDVALDDALVSGIAADLARFLDALHGISPGLLDAIEIPRFTPDGWVERHQMLYRRTRDAVRRGLGATEFERYEAWWCDYLTNPEYRAFEPRLIHGDLAPEHVLIEMEPWRLSGIIDFGDAMWADPALDLAGLPDLLARAVVTEMQSITPDWVFWARRAAYRQIAPSHAVFAGRDLGRPELLRGGIDALRCIFGQLETSP
jgi:aminoglycoside 2''-phosphotransferase